MSQLCRHGHSSGTKHQACELHVVPLVTLRSQFVSEAGCAPVLFQFGGRDIIMLVAATKCDLRTRYVSREEGEAWAAQRGCPFFEVMPPLIALQNPWPAPPQGIRASSTGDLAPSLLEGQGAVMGRAVRCANSAKGTPSRLREAHGSGQSPNPPSTH